MDEFFYTNIFDTKGVEYLIIIGFLLLIIPFWIFLNKPVRLKKTLGVLSENILRIPQGLFYSMNHTWTHMEKSGYAKVGLDDLLMHITGEVKLINLKTPGERINKGDLIAEIKQDGKHLTISSPISGEIQSINTLHSETPEVLNEDPYGKGWICKIKPEKWVAETNSYLLAEDASEWSKKELAKFKDFVAISMRKLSPESSMIIMQEGGELSDNPLSGMPNEVWQDFQRQFIDQIS
jgi:glycine cleavage system H protein